MNIFFRFPIFAAKFHSQIVLISFFHCLLGSLSSFVSNSFFLLLSPLENKIIKLSILMFFLSLSLSLSLFFFLSGNVQYLKGWEAGRVQSFHESFNTMWIMHHTILSICVLLSFFFPTFQRSHHYRSVSVNSHNDFSRIIKLMFSAPCHVSLLFFQISSPLLLLNFVSVILSVLLFLLSLSLLLLFCICQQPLHAEVGIFFSFFSFFCSLTSAFAASMCIIRALLASVSRLALAW